jgi:hypothetical protein
MNVPTIPLPIESAAPVGMPVKRGSSVPQPLRVRLDAVSHARIGAIRQHVEQTTGTRLSTSMVVCLSLLLTTARIDKGTAEELYRRILAAKDGR